MTTGTLGLCNSKRIDGTRCGGEVRLRWNSFREIYETHCAFCPASMWGKDADQLTADYHAVAARYEHAAVQKANPPPYIPLARLEAFVRGHLSGGCRMLSEGPSCLCPLCDLDRVRILCDTALKALKSTQQE